MFLNLLKEDKSIKRDYMQDQINSKKVTIGSIKDTIGVKRHYESH